MANKKGGLPPYKKTGQSSGTGHLDTAHNVASDGGYKGVNKIGANSSTKVSASSGTLGINQPIAVTSGYKNAGEQRMTTLGRVAINTKPKK